MVQISLYICFSQGEINTRSKSTINSKSGIRCYVKYSRIRVLFPCKDIIVDSDLIQGYAVRENPYSGTFYAVKVILKGLHLVSSLELIQRRI